MADIIQTVREAKELSFEQSFNIAQHCSCLLSSETNEDVEYGRRIIINILDNWHKLDCSSHDIWENIVESAGFYPYVDRNNFTLNNFSGEIRKGLYASSNIEGRYFHDEQKEIVDLLNSGRNVIVSAPTSFGKSLIIEEMVAANKYHSIVVIQPTLALLDETRKKLHKYSDSYKLVVRTSQEPSTEKGNIFLFTAERVCEYTHFKNVDFLVIDEFYKLSGSRDDERSSSLNNAFYKMLKQFKPQFYLLGPNIDKISEGFDTAYGAVFFKSNYSLVDSNIIDSYSGSGKKGAKDKETQLFELLLSMPNEQTIIYCSSPDRVRKLSKKFYQYMISNREKIEETNLPIIEWIEHNISKKWSIINALKLGIGIHDAALQKHITTSIIDYFNDCELKYLFCTSTIIEGVNTSTKNIVYFDDRKGPNKIDYFDYSNIRGRAGRMMVHYTGNIYNFNVPPEKEDIAVDIPFFEQSPIKDEVLIQLDENNVKNKETQQYQDLKDIPDAEREIIKKNGVSVKGQLEILRQLRADINSDASQIRWTRKPTYAQLGYALKLAWNNLLLDSESKVVSPKQLTYLTFNYGCVGKSFIQLKDEDVIYNIDKYKKKNGVERVESDVILQFEDDAIKRILQIVRHWFEYKVPKWLSVVNSLQTLVCQENKIRPGDYSYFASVIENDFLPDHLTLLSEYGIPHSAIKKIASVIPNTISDDSLVDYIKQQKVHTSHQLIDYEKEKLITLF